MSNCCLVDGCYGLLPEFIDLERLQADMEDHVRRGEPKETIKDRYLYYYVQGAITFWTDPDEAGWTPGQGCRSSHTFRDLDGMGLFLGLYAKEKCLLRVIAMDEENPQLGWGHHVIKVDPERAAELDWGKPEYA